MRYESATCLELVIDRHIVNVPRWMTQADLCRRFTCGDDPAPKMQALVQILKLLDNQQR